MSADIHLLPVWKQNSTVAEYLRECAALAERDPAEWQKVVLIRGEVFEGGGARAILYHKNTNIVEALGIIEMGKDQYLERCKNAS